MIHAYDIHGLLRVESETALPELAYFKVARLDAPPDITVHRGRPEDNPRLELPTHEATVREFLGGAGFSLTITARASGIDVHANWLLHRSPHVLYTNVIEPILRWLLVERGLVFAHGACIAVDGQALLVTAQTDTGKTTTILRTLDAEPYAFLSDDLTILAPDGTLRSYPKPLTISSHTVQAVRAARLSPGERRGLPLQSRIHSRNGRKIAFWLTESRLPVASINAVTQLLVPPPKYHIDRLIPNVTIASEAQLRGLGVIVRSDRDVSRELGAVEATQTLVANTDDAFGFPPYARIEEFMTSVVGSDIRAREHEVIHRALEGLPAVEFESASMNWAEDVRGWMRSLAAADAGVQTMDPALAVGDVTPLRRTPAATDS